MKSKSLEKILKEPSVIFNEVKHTYTHKTTGDLYTGCSTISEAWAKDFLGPWYAKEMYLFLENPKIYEAIKSGTPEEYIKLITEAKGAARVKGDEAKENGTLAHNWMEQAITAKIQGKKKVAKIPTSEQAKNSVNAFISWAKERNIFWLASEEVVSSDEFKVGGKLDAIATIDGITYLVDFKTSKQLSPSYLLQCAGYDLMLREMGLQVTGYLLLRLPKDGTQAETLTVTNREDMEFFRQTFLRQREAHKFYVYMESKFKEAGKMRVDAPEIKLSAPIETLVAKNKPKVATKRKK